MISAMRRQDFALFWSVPPDAQDWDNLAISGVKRVQLVAAFADAATVIRLGDMGVKVTIRLDEPDYADDAARGRQHAKLAALRPQRGGHRNDRCRAGELPQL